MPTRERWKDVERLDRHCGGYLDRRIIINIISREGERERETVSTRWCVCNNNNNNDNTEDKLILEEVQKSIWNSKCHNHINGDLLYRVLYYTYVLHNRCNTLRSHISPNDSVLTVTLKNFPALTIFLTQIIICQCEINNRWINDKPKINKRLNKFKHGIEEKLMKLMINYRSNLVGKIF